MGGEGKGLFKNWTKYAKCSLQLGLAIALVDPDPDLQTDFPVWPWPCLLLWTYPAITGLCQTLAALTSSGLTSSWHAGRLPDLSSDLPQQHVFIWWSGLLVKPGYHFQACPAHLAWVLQGIACLARPLPCSAVLSPLAPGSPSLREQLAHAASWQQLTSQFVNLWVVSSPGAELCNSPRWTSQDIFWCNHQVYRSSYVLKFCYLLSVTDPNLVPPTDLLRVHFVSSSMSLKMFSNVTPSTVTCGTLAISSQPDMKPLITILWGKFSPHLTVLSSSLYFLSFQMRMLWEAASRALLVLRCITSTDLPLSTDAVVSSLKVNRLVRCGLPFVNPCWLFPIIFLSFIYFESDSDRMCPMTLGLKWCALVYSSLNLSSCLFLKMSVTLAFFSY